MKPGKLIGQGRTAEIFECGEDKILKLFRSGISKTLSEAEYKASLEINKKINSSPKVYDFIEIYNRNGIIYERINGTTMLKVISTKPWRLSKEAHRLAKLHKSIQQKIDFELPKYTDMLKFGDVPEKSHIEKKLIDLFRKKLYLEYIKEYINISKVNINQIKKWELPIAAARLNELLPESEKRNLLIFVNSELNKL